ncbi:hypothetical protein SDC9_115138 [bioreactor metagenome]|uniref:Uncharacterized protein n=1 Tax=bioreactor metagenome TaxID=1076179 RepID=A0A645BSJ6_9ZZZZ
MDVIYTQHKIELYQIEKLLVYSLFVIHLYLRELKPLNTNKLEMPFPHCSLDLYQV